MDFTKTKEILEKVVGMVKPLLTKNDRSRDTIARMATLHPESINTNIIPIDPKTADIFFAIEDTIWTTSNLFIRLSYVIDDIKKHPTKVDWDAITKLIYLRSDVKYDYNINLPEKFTSLRQIEELRLDIVIAQGLNREYHVAKCLVCEDEFVLSFEETRDNTNEWEDVRICKVCKHKFSQRFQ